MPKITLGKTPKTFAPTNVTFKLPDNTEASIECTFKYRTRKQFGEFLQATFAAGAAEADTADIGAIIGKSVDKNGEYIAAVVDRWNLDEPLTAESAAQLADEVPAAVGAIMTAYRSAVMDGHLGN